MNDCFIIVDSNERFIGWEEDMEKELEELEGEELEGEELGEEDDIHHKVTSSFENTPLFHFCGDDGWIRLLCKYDPQVGVIYNGKVVFYNNEFTDFHRGEETFEEMYKDDEEDKEDVCYKFHEKNPKSTWYYFYCTNKTDSLKKEDIDYISSEKNRVLVKPNGFTLHKDGQDYQIGYTGAHVHLYIPIDDNIKSTM